MFQTKEELKAEPDVDDILSRSSSGLSTPSSFEFMTEEMFMGNQRKDCMVTRTCTIIIYDHTIIHSLYMYTTYMYISVVDFQFQLMHFNH